jgi:hypothetical protein
MKHKFCLTCEIDTTVAIAVAAYLDGEHYIFLHSQYSNEWVVLDHDPSKRTTIVKQTWKLFGLHIGQIYTCEYVPPAQFKNYDVKPSSWFVPSIHHLISVKTDLKYTANPAKNTTISTLDVEIDLPFWLYPLRYFIQKGIEKLKVEKDIEDIEMIDRRAKLFGRGNNAAYLLDHQFMLYKDDYVSHFGNS